MPKVRVDRLVGRQRGQAVYYCNKCGHMGADGPGHCKPTLYLAHLTPCDYDAALVPDSDQMPLQDVANVMARHLPGGWEVSLCMERGAAWVTLHNPEGDVVPLPDAADKSLTLQLSDALVMAYGLTPNGPHQRETTALTKPDSATD